MFVLLYACAALLCQPSLYGTNLDKSNMRRASKKEQKIQVGVRFLLFILINNISQINSDSISPRCLWITIG